MYDVNYFIRKFTNTRDDKWCIGRLHNQYGESCANGWCGVRFLGRPVEVHTTEESIALQQVMAPLSSKKLHVFDVLPDYSSIAAHINNGTDPRYRQPTPKERILAALYDIKRMQEGEKSSFEKEVVTKTVYVKVEEGILEEPCLQ